MKLWKTTLILLILLIISSYLLGFSISKCINNYKENIKYWMHVVDIFLFSLFTFVSFLYFIAFLVKWASGEE